MVKQTYCFSLEPSLIKMLDDLINQKPNRPSRSNEVGEAIAKHIAEEMVRLRPRDISVAR